MRQQPEYLVLEDGETYTEDRYGLSGIEGMDLSVILIDRVSGEMVDRAGFTIETKDDVADDAIITTGIFR